MEHEDSLDGALHEAFGGAGEESVVARLHRLSGVNGRILLHDARGDESPLLRVPGSVQDQGASDDSRYRIVGEIARGGVGVVYKARDRDLGRDVALKVLRREHAGRPEVLERLVEEAQIGGQLQHPGIVPVYGMGLQPDGRPYLAMKLIKGRTLAAILKKRSGSAHDRVRLLRIFEQVCQTMAYAHTRGVIHRDLKPSNVMIGGFGEVQIVDWGFGKVLGHEDPMAERLKERTIVATVRSRGEGSESLVGSVMGTPAYMPPEQALGQIEELDERSDVFALGAILCQVLTGEPPYTGDPRDLLTMAAHARLDEANARLDACDADAGLVALCRRALAPLRADRPRNAAELADAVESHFAAADERAREAEVRGVQEAARLVRERQEATWARRSKRKTIALAATVLLAVATAGGAWLLTDAQRRERLDALRATARGALDDATRLHGAGQWHEAAAKARSARNLAAQYDALAALRDEAHALAERAAAEAVRVERRDRLLSGLREAALAWTGVVGRAGVDAAYRGALDEAGLDFQIGTADVLAREILAAFPEATTEIAAMLDGWAWQSGRDLPAAVARRIDDDAWRTRLRDAVDARDAATLEAMQADAFEQDLPPETLHLLGNALGVSGRPDAAAAFFDQLRARTPGDFTAHNGALRWSADSRDPEQQVARATAAVSLRPSSAAAWANLGNALLGIGDNDACAAASLTAIRLEPDFSLAHNNLGLARQRLGDVDGAIAAYRDAVRIQPSHAGAHCNLGAALVLQGDVDEGLAACREAVRLEPSYAGAHSNLGLALAAKDDVDGAVASYREAIRLDPNLAAAYNNLAAALRRTGDMRGAVAALREAVRLEPDSANSHSDLGVVLGSTGDLEGAIREFHEAIRIDPGMAGAHYNLGRVLRAKGDVDGAIAAYRETIRIQPDYAQAYVNMGSAFRRKGDLQVAIGLFREALRIQPDLPQAHCSLGLALRDRGEFREALTSLRQGHELGSRRPDWPHPSARWVKDAERLVRLEGLMPDIVAGKAEPKDAEEHQILAGMLYLKKRYEESATLFADLIQRYPDRAPRDRYDAACSAVLAGTPAWRARALEWLRAHFESGAKKPDLGHWLGDPDLAAVRDRIDDLPERERAGWKLLWNDVVARWNATKGD